MYLKNLAAVSVALLIGASTAWADETQPNTPAADVEVSQPVVSESVMAESAAVTPDQIKERFEAKFPGVEATEVRNTPFVGLYEIRIGRDLIYTDNNVDFLLQGALIDTKSREDLTAQRIGELNKVKFSDLPLELAVKQVYGKGTYQIAVFEDPNCIYCKRLHQTLQQIDDVTVHTFLFPILSEDSIIKARNVWCAQDQAKVWVDWMLGGKEPEPATCDMPLEELLALGRGLMVEGTPAIIFSDDSRVNGAMGKDALLEKLSSIQQGS